MDYSKKTKEELIAEIQSLQAHCNSLEEQCNEEIDRHKQGEVIYHSMIANSPLGMYFYTLNDEKQLVFTGSNPAADTILKIDNSQFIGKTIGEAFPPLIETEVPQRYTEAAEKGTQWSTEYLSYEDDKIVGAFEVKAFQTTPGSMVAIFDDITKRKQSEQLLKEKTEEIEIQNKQYVKINKELVKTNEELQIAKLQIE